MMKNLSQVIDQFNNDINDQFAYFCSKCAAELVQKRIFLEEIPSEYLNLNNVDNDFSSPSILKGHLQNNNNNHDHRSASPNQIKLNITNNDNLRQSNSFKARFQSFKPVSSSSSL